MKKIKSFLFLIIFLFYINDSNATVYYISNYGSDSNNGISPVYPIQSIQKLNSIIFKLQPGDAVLFERGSVFYGQVNINTTGNNTQPIIFGAYGKGKNPVISGSIPIVDWKVFKGDIYKAIVQLEVKDVFVNSKRMILARYPNSDYLRIDKPFSNPNKGFTDKDLKQPNGYWNGSNVRIRTENWVYEYTETEEYKNGSITFTKPTYYSAKTDWGYYLDNIKDEIDMEGEWFFDKKNTISENTFLFSPNKKDPNELNVQGTVSDYGFFSLVEITNVIIQNLEFRNQFVSGIYFTKIKSKLKIEGCTFRGQNQTGIYFSGDASGSIISNCRLYDINGKALYLLKVNKTIVSNCIFRNIGMIPGYGIRGDDFPMSAAIVFGDGNRISGNNINQVGHNGINCIGTENIIEKNTIKNTLLLLNDGGAVKCFGELSRNSVWKNNFISNVPGNIETTDRINKIIIALGFYLDQLSNNIKISQNTISGCGSAGVGINAGFNITFEENICYNNTAGATFYSTEFLCKNNIFKGNTLFCNIDDQIAILNQSLYQSNVPGSFNYNKYLNPSNYNIFRILEKNIYSDNNFDKWKNLVKSDYNSILTVNQDVFYSKLFPNASDDSLTIVLNSVVNYKDINLNSVYGSIRLMPWSSQILIADSDISNLPELNVFGETLKLGAVDEPDGLNSNWYNLDGNSLKNPVIISAPDGFEISLNDDINFSKSLSINPENGFIDIIIFVRCDADEDRNYYGYISNKSGNIERKIRVSANSK